MIRRLGISNGSFPRWLPAGGITRICASDTMPEEVVSRGWRELFLEREKRGADMQVRACGDKNSVLGADRACRMSQIAELMFDVRIGALAICGKERQSEREQ
jgi:hypothetical protein